MNFATRLYGVCALAGLCALAPQARAQALDIVPIAQVLDAGQRTASFTLVNRGSQPTRVQVRSFQWTQANNTDTFAPTQALLVSPPFAQIAPGQSQTVRILLRQAAAGNEQAYRVFFDQLPEADASKVALAFRLTVPVFADAAARAKADVSWTVVQDHGQWSLVAHNAGQAHAQLASLTLTTADGHALKLTRPALPYLLAGQDGRWLIAPSSTALHAGDRLHLTTAGRGNAMDRWLTLDQPR
ncbi:fimbrial biogenesis chaperone [Pseudomonas sp. TE3610]